MYRDEEEASLRLKSQELFDDMLVGSKQRKRAEISLENGDIWNVDNISLLLNTLKGWHCDRNIPRVYKSKSQTCADTAYYSFEDNNNKKYRIFIHVKVPIRSIRVEVTTDFLIDQWDKTSVTIDSLRGSQGRRNVSPQKVTINTFHFSVDISDRSSFALLHRKSMEFYEQTMFSEPFDCFASTLCRCGFIYDKKSSIFNYYEKFHSYNKIKKPKNEETFMKNAHGYLLFRTSDIVDDDKFDIYENGDEKQSIIDGVYISSFASSILRENADIVDGLIMDTTWKVMKNYVTSILVASSFSVSIPLGFSFGAAETKDLYELLFIYFKSKLDIDLSQYIIESDQGSALRSVCEHYGNEHLACLRHLLVSLRYDEFGFQVANLDRSHFQQNLLRR